jgi:replicative DNA helicase
MLFAMSSNKIQDITATTFEFTHEIQRCVIAMLLCDKESFIRVKDLIRKEYFDAPIHKDIVGVVMEFEAKYDKVPSDPEILDCLLVNGSKTFTQDQYSEELLQILDSAADKNDETFDFRYVADRTADFAKFQSVRKAILDSPALLARGNYGKIMELVKSAMMIGEGDEVGSLYFDSIEERLQRRANGLSRADLAIRTGLGSLDFWLGGGIAPGELGIMMGPAKRGKSTACVNFAKGAMMQGKNVFHFIAEGSKERTETMYDASISGVAKEMLVAEEPRVREVVNDFKNHMAQGRLVVKFFPPLALTALAIESYIQKERVIHNIKPDLVVVDYLGLMRVAEKGYITESSSNGRYLFLGQIVKELISFVKRHNVAMWLVHQTKGRTMGHTREGPADLDDSADSSEVMRDADLILSFNQTDIENDRNECRIFIAGGRETPDRKTVHLYFDKECCQIRELERTQP